MQSFSFVHQRPYHSATHRLKVEVLSLDLVERLVAALVEDAALVVHWQPAEGVAAEIVPLPVEPVPLPEIDVDNELA